LCAVLLNFSAAVVSAFIIMNFLKQRQNSDRQGTAQRFRVMASLEQTPEHGVLLRWRKRTGEELSPLLYIAAKSQPARGHGAESSANEVTIDRLPLEQVPTMNDNGVICEFLFPVSLALKMRAYEKSGDGLKYQHVYRFQIEGYDSDYQTLLGRSDWSNAVYINPPTSVFDAPFRFIKAFCPVPTSSLEFFMDKYAERNIAGTVPQHLVVLTNMQITYHKNFRDYAEYQPGDSFYLVAFAGDSQGTCEQETRSGRCMTYARTTSFNPVDYIELDDDGDELNEEERTQQLDANQVLRLGAIDRKHTVLSFTLRLRDAMDAAEGKVDWEDLMEAFEEIDQNDVVDQLYTVDLKNEEEFNEDYLARVTFKVTFTNSIDKLAVEKRPDDRFFQLDAPGQMFYEGEERMVTWDPDSTKLAGNANFEPKMNIYAVYPDLRVEKVLIGNNVQRENGVGWTFMVQFPRLSSGRRVFEAKSSNVVTCHLEVYISDESDPDSYKWLANSHRFLVTRSWMLKDAELMYASFCKMNGMSMKSFNKSNLEQLGLTTTSVPLKLLAGLRDSMQFEREDIVDDDNEVIQCADMLKIGNITVEAATYVAEHDHTGMDVVETGSVASDRAKRRLSGHISEGGTTGSATGRQVGTGDAEKRIFRPTSRKVDVLQHIWPKPYPRSWLSVEYGTDWNPCFLLVHSFYPIDNIMSAAKSLVRNLKVFSQGDQQDPPVLRVGGSDAANLAELVFLGGLPFVVEAFLFFLQLLVFVAFPLLVIVAALVLEYYMTFSEDKLVYLTHIGEETSFLPDLVFRSSISGVTAGQWIARLPTSSTVAFLMFTLFIISIIALIFESNFLRNAWPWPLQTSARRVMNKLGDMIIGCQMISTLIFACTLVLWFLMTVVLYPEQMITVIACVAGLAFLLYTMVVQYQITRQNIARYLQQEVPEILDLVCDSFLEEYDKKNASKYKLGERSRKQAEEASRSLIEKFLMERFANHRHYKDHFKYIFSGKAHHLSVGHRIWDRALLKEGEKVGKGGRKLPCPWKMLLQHEERKARKYGFELPSGGASQPGLHLDLAASGGGQPGGQKAKSTTKILADFGYAQEETAELTHFDLKVRLLDRENEQGGECVHQYSKELRLKLMHIFVRFLEEEKLPQDIADLVNDPDRLGHAIYNAHEAKLQVMNPLRLTSEGARVSRQISASGPGDEFNETTLLELLIQDVNNQKMKPQQIYETLVAHLDDALHPETLGEIITPFVEERMSDEIETQLRLTLDEQTVGKAMQRLFENLRIWKGRFAEGDAKSDERLVKGLTLLPRQPGRRDEGLMATMEELGIIHAEATQHFREFLFKSLERKVREWQHDDVAGGNLMIDSADLEEFVRELLKKGLWWYAVEELLLSVGFPMGDEEDAVPRREVIAEFEKMCLRDGFMPKEHVLEFFREITRADESDGPAGRIWKSRMVVLLKEVAVCGYVQAADGAKRAISGVRTPTASVISKSEEEKVYWPEWLNEEWGKVATTYESKHGREPKRERSLRQKPFLAKSKIQQFMKNLLFSETLHVQSRTGTEGGDEGYDAALLLERDLEIINKEYDNWYKHKDPDKAEVWTKRGKSLLKLRGIWSECFYAVLESLENKVDEKKRDSGETLFDTALSQWRGKASKPDHTGGPFHEGLLDISFFKKWLKKTLVNNKDCSLPVFKDVLKRAQITLPELVADALWYAGRVGELHASLRNARDLEDRLVMYLSKGLCYESVRSLVFDELQTSSLQEITQDELRVIFDQMDMKTGRCGFAEPHEVHELICMMTQQGMTCERLIQAFKRLKMTFPDKNVKAAFMLMDTNADDDIDLPEFLGLIDHLIVSVIPEAIFDYLQLEPWQIAAKLAVATVTLLIVFMFIFISLSAFQVKLGGNNTDAGAGASLIRAGIALVAALGLRREAGNDEEREGLYVLARERLYYLTGVTQSQVEARRRNLLGGQQILQGPKKVKIKLPSRKGRRGSRSEEDEEDEDDDGGGDDD